LRASSRIAAAWTLAGASAPTSHVLVIRLVRPHFESGSELCAHVFVIGVAVFLAGCLLHLIRGLHDLNRLFFRDPLAGAMSLIMLLLHAAAFSLGTVLF
jgi:hypothetical protein